MSFAPRFTSLLLTPLLGLGPLFAQVPVNDTLQLRVADSDGPQITPNSRSNKGISVEVSDGNGARVSDAAVAVRLPDTASTGTFADGTHSAVAYTDGSGIAHISGIQWSSTPGPVTIRITATHGAAHTGMLLEESLASTPNSVIAPSVPAPTPRQPAELERAETPARDLARPSPAMPKVQIAGVQVSGDVEPSGRITRTPIAPVIHESGTGPAVSIVTRPGGEAGHASRKKWFIIAGVAGAAGVGVFLATRSHSSTSSTTAASGTTIGAPTINIGR